METAFQMALYHMSSMMAGCLLFILAGWKKETIDRKQVIEFAKGILHTYMTGFVIALIIVGLIKALL